jgi:hypothetical protein
MLTAPWIRSGIVVVVAVAAGCSGFSQQCTVDSDCNSASLYCNSAAQACFVRSGGDNVPIIDSAPVTGNQISISGTAPALATVFIFTDSQCVGPVLVSGPADSAGAFTLTATVPSSTGNLYATAESASLGSICSGAFPY